MGHNKRTCDVKRAARPGLQIEVAQDSGKAMAGHAQQTSQMVNPSSPFVPLDLMNSDEELSQVSNMDYFISIADEVARETIGGTFVPMH